MFRLLNLIPDAMKFCRGLQSLKSRQHGQSLLPRGLKCNRILEDVHTPASTLVISNTRIPDKGSRLSALAAKVLKSAIPKFL